MAAVPAVALQFTRGSMVALKTLQRDLDHLHQDFARPGGFRKPIERAIREVIIPSIDRNFEEGGRPEKWEPLSPSWMARRLGIFTMGELIPIQLAGGGPPVLQWKGFLRRSATALARWHISENTATYGNWPRTVFYGPIHDFGLDAGDFEIPARPFALLQEEDVDEIENIFLEFIEERVDDRVRLRYFG